MDATATAHIVIDDQGRAWIDGANTRVYEVVELHAGQHLGPEQLHDELPHLSLAEIYAALGYYYDHKEAFDLEMADWAIEYQLIWEANLDSPGRRRLRALGLLD